ncbi:hypothetical protein [Devosia aurantiaca]|uniref:Uncharacterized protein n=1 Tax=Devosia aurantiaca TaxID=2714858 RepID=A0A6M1SQK2_9HYPH|nr:hypothetical protein [Devosia aurantiaca]NGP18924.1 hypothetical protein [Devosia aurantiaca]
MKLFLVLSSVFLLATPVAAQSDKGKCAELAASMSALSAHYRTILEELTDVPTGSVVNSLDGTQQEAALAWNDAHVALRPVLTAYVERLEDLTYSLQTCRR